MNFIYHRPSEFFTGHAPDMETAKRYLHQLNRHKLEHLWSVRELGGKNPRGLDIAAKLVSIQ